MGEVKGTAIWGVYKHGRTLKSQLYHPFISCHKSFGLVWPKNILIKMLIKATLAAQLSSCHFDNKVAKETFRHDKGCWAKSAANSL